MTPVVKATCIGLLAPALWGMSVGIVRGVTEDFGLGPGFTIMYGVAFLFLLLLFGKPPLKRFSLKYLIFGIGSANLCALCFIFSLSMAQNAEQTVQVGMVNYLWPCLTIVFAVLFNGERARWWLVPGVLICLAGVFVVLGGEKGFDLMGFLASWDANPWSYTIALIGAFLWASYSSMTRAWSGGNNPTVVIFFNDMVVFSLIWALTPSAPLEWLHPGWIGVFFGCRCHGARLWRLDLWDAARQHDVACDRIVLYARLVMCLCILLDWRRTHEYLLAGRWLVGFRVTCLLVVCASNEGA